MAGNNEAFPTNALHQRVHVIKQCTDAFVIGTHLPLLNLKLTNLFAKGAGGVLLFAVGQRTGDARTSTVLQ